MIYSLQKSALGQRAYPSSPGHALPVECYSMTELHVHALPLQGSKLTFEVNCPIGQLLFKF